MHPQTLFFAPTSYFAFFSFIQKWISPFIPVYHATMTRLIFLLLLMTACRAAASAEAACPGLKGDALQKCLQGDRQQKSPSTILFKDPDGKDQRFDTAAVTRSIETVCQQTKQDGVYTAYRSGQDRARNRIWKEVECRSGKVEGLWKEYFPEDDMTIVLYYDTAGNSVKQGLYVGGQLVREQPITSSKQNK